MRKVDKGKRGRGRHKDIYGVGREGRIFLIIDALISV